MNHRLEYVFDMFENVLRKKYHGEDVRDTQVKLAIAVADLIASKDKILMCHAPVGTGKTFGALVPGIYDTLNNKSRLIYATSSLNLQAQLKNEELHFLEGRGDIENFIVAKGITNYLCEDKVEPAALDDSIKTDLLQFSWQTNEGDRVDFEKNYYPLTDDMWAMVRLEKLKDCQFCSKRTSCPTAKHRSKFNNPSINVVVTNHNQLVQSVLNIQEGKPPILDINMLKGLIVIDEAHDFEDAILSQLADRIILKDLAKLFKKMGYERRCKAMKSLLVINNYIKKLKYELDSTRGRQKISDTCLEAVSGMREELNKEITERSAQKLDYNRLFRPKEDDNESDITAELLNKILDTSKFSSWITFDDEKAEITIVNKKFRANARSIISEMLRNNKLVFMSGTLAVDNSFDNIYYSLNARFQNITHELILNTVFDYKEQALVYVPKNLPIPIPSISERFREYTRILTEEIIELIKITGGRTLILCTSYKQLNLISELLQPVLDSMGITLLKQKDKSIELLSEEFKDKETSVLIGTGSFFAGLSVPGRSLISVILCRLPFPNAEDPFIDLLGNDLNLSEKMEYLFVPRMIIKLLQAAGRLIRTKNDFGCFTILDPRLFSERYGKRVLGELEAIGYPLTQDREEVRKFIKQKFKKPQDVHYPVYEREQLDITESLLKDDKPRKIEKKTEKPKSSLADLENIITTPQKTYFEMVRKRAGLTTAIFETIKSPYDLFSHLKKLIINRELTFNIDEEFPFLTPEQKQSCINKFDMANKKIAINRKTSQWSKDQINNRLKDLKIKKHTSVKEWDK
ncbi:ATP-dependent DNA helicase [Desulfitobacterium sp. AusDCA]|uniref:ATP-dependent DNA helicase n=1 Tax=Desulfitobacterium sp. AusDCA TaxID=3240383 RepID=UPI003DA70FAE